MHQNGCKLLRKIPLETKYHLSISKQIPDNDDESS